MSTWIWYGTFLPSENNFMLGPAVSGNNNTWEKTANSLIYFILNTVPPRFFKLSDTSNGEQICHCHVLGNGVGGCTYKSQQEESLWWWNCSFTLDGWLSMSWLGNYATILQDVTNGATGYRVHRISLYYFLQLHVNVQLSQNIKSSF